VGNPLLAAELLLEGEFYSQEGAATKVVLETARRTPGEKLNCGKSEAVNQLKLPFWVTWC